MSRHKIKLHSPNFGYAVIVLLTWQEKCAPMVAYITFDNPMHRAEVTQHGADLMAWLDSLANDNPYPLPLSWSVVESDLDI